MLVGLPGAGKTTVGRLVADCLNLSVYDIDDAIEQNEHTSIREIIETRGEREFRRLERLEAERAITGSPAVVVPGGGWAAEKGNLESVRGRALTVYLKTTPEIAAKRVEKNNDRPLLDSDHPHARMLELFDKRRPFYERCDSVVTTDGKTVEEVAAEVAELARHAAAG